MYIFGSGVLIGTPSGSNPTPVNFGLIQNVTIEETSSLKPLFGQNKRALAVGGGTIRTTGKATMARISGLAFASLFYGVTPEAGQLATLYGEAKSVPASSAYTIQVDQHATWTADLGVLYAATGVPLKRVAAAPEEGEYSVAAGVYTFSEDDASAAMLLSYNYTIASTGQTVTIDNQLLGSMVTFGVNLYGRDPTTNNGLTLQLYKCASSRLSFGTKLEDWAMPEMDFEAYVNDAGNLGIWSFADAL